MNFSIKNPISRGSSIAMLPCFDDQRVTPSKKNIATKTPFVASVLPWLLSLLQRFPTRRRCLNSIPSRHHRFQYENGHDLDDLGGTSIFGNLHGFQCWIWLKPLCSEIVWSNTFNLNKYRAVAYEQCSKPEMSSPCWLNLVDRDSAHYMWLSPIFLGS